MNWHLKIGLVVFAALKLLSIDYDGSLFESIFVLGDISRLMSTVTDHILKKSSCAFFLLCVQPNSWLQP